MQREYRVKRKLQEQRGSYFVTLPKLWVESWDLEEGDLMSLVFDGIVKVIPPSILLEYGSSTTKEEVTSDK
jgi:hypothetical protein